MGGAPLIGTLGDASPAIHPQAWIAPGAVIVGDVSVAARSSVWYGAVLRGDDERILVGEDCNIQDLCCLHSDRGEPTMLQEQVSIGHHATVHGAIVHAGALIGIGATVLGGAVVGAGSLVAAGAVVLPGAHVPPGVLFAGVPGRVVRELSDAERENLAQTALRYTTRATRHASASWSC